MSTVTFTPTGNSFLVPFTGTASNVSMGLQQVSQQSLFKVDNSSGNLVFVTFSTVQATANSVNHPTAGNSTNSFACRTGATTLINPNLGLQTANIFVGAISVSGTGNIYIQPGI
jgi:hypothetical protein